ncbi:MAG: ABC transporter ATP-binding protein [Caulobacterales bacterium]|uniref:ABC transporter ATP-binding protein n=1 Tax=Glycocaulis sp. TaxID=1969725 RepID=UPI003FA190B2
MIDAHDLVKQFGPTRAVDGISFSARTGEVVALLGPNGAGKSTTMRMLTGCLEPDAGTAAIAGHDCVTARRAAQNALGYLPEGAPAYPAMTPRAFTRFHLRVRGFSGKALTEAAELALERTRMGDAAARPIGMLSKGFKRRAALAAAIAHDPPVLILDEPTDGLDPNQKDGVRALIGLMAPEKTILISTHLLDEVEAICTRAIVIAAGRIAADTTPAELVKSVPDMTLAGAFRHLTGHSAEQAVARARGHKGRVT